MIAQDSHRKIDYFEVESILFNKFHSTQHIINKLKTNEMTEEQTRSWIFLATVLATNSKPSDINGISMIADGINHAIPTQKELQSSISWLMKRNLIVKLGKHYDLTEEGKIEYKIASIITDKIFTIWKNLEIKFNSFKDHP